MKRSLALAAMLSVVLIMLTSVSFGVSCSSQESNGEIAMPTVTETLNIESNELSLNGNDLYIESEPEVIYYTEDDIVMISKVMWQECRGVPSDTEKACVAWTVLNRADEYNQSISSVITAPNQFAYYKSTIVDDGLYNLARDVLERWNREKNGEENVGRVLPPEYLWYSGNGYHNFFRDAYKGNWHIWDYSLESPYET